MVSPALETVDTLIRVISWPTLLGGCVWVIRKWDASQREFKDLHANTKLAAETVIQVKAEVDTLKTNHLAHLQDGICRLAESNDKAVDVLQKIDTGIQILVDRERRA